MEVYLLIIDSQFESSGTPIDELNGSPHFDAGDGLVRVAGDDITPIQKRTSHIMGCPRVTDDHLIVRFETLESDVLNTMAFMLCLCF